jgi:membrane-associated phospholipid phosphatase
MVTEKHLTAPEAARLMMLTSASLADAFIASWRLKFTHNLIRPRTYIRMTMDSTWEPAIPTPPFPEFVSGHAALSAAAATTMTAVLGTVAFEDSTNLNLGHPVRKFGSFMDAASEAGLSRIYGGIHFPSGNAGGRSLGECVGAKVFDRLKTIPAQ